jgi:hypothetical protein
MRLNYLVSGFTVDLAIEWPELDADRSPHSGTEVLIALIMM